MSLSLVLSNSYHLSKQGYDLGSNFSFSDPASLHEESHSANSDPRWGKDGRLSQAAPDPSHPSTASGRRGLLRDLLLEVPSLSWLLCPQKKKKYKLKDIHSCLFLHTHTLLPLYTLQIRAQEKIQVMSCYGREEGLSFLFTLRRPLENVLILPFEPFLKTTLIW